MTRWTKPKPKQPEPPPGECCGARCTDAGCCPYQYEPRQEGLFDEKS